MPTTIHKLNRIYFYISGDCNLRCRHCWIDPADSGGAESRFLALDTFEQIVAQAMDMGVSGVKLTGGEPLLHPGIFRMLDIIRDNRLGLVLETNAVLCTPRFAAKLAECPGAKVAVSLDGSEAETHDWIRDTKGCFRLAVKGIEELVKVGIRPQVIATVFRRNLHQLESIVRLAEALGAGSVKFNVLQPISRGQDLHDRDEQLGIGEIVRVGRWVNLHLRQSTSLPVSFDYPLAFESLERIFCRGETGCGTCGILGILGVLWDGSYAVCGIGETVPELVLGHADRDPLRNVWRDSPVLHEIRSGLPHRLEGTCGDCLLSPICFGNCIAHNYYNGKTFWSPYWFCETARKQGFFPESRLRPPISGPINPEKGEAS
jgi:SynChlorMet cassette radical SAM/SPASM protein ScmF